MNRILLVLFMLVSCTVVATAQNTDVYEEIPSNTSQNELAEIKKNLQDQGVTLNITKVLRNSKGNIKSIDLTVTTSKGTVTYNTSKFTRIVIKSTTKDGLSVSAESDQ
jgi:hypothetical protein